MTVINMTKLTLLNAGVQNATIDCVVIVFSYLAWLSAHKLNIMGRPLTCAYTVFIIMKFIISKFTIYKIRKKERLPDIPLSVHNACKKCFAQHTSCANVLLVKMYNKNSSITIIMWTLQCRAPSQVRESFPGSDVSWN